MALQMGLCLVSTHRLDANKVGGCMVFLVKP